MRLSLIAPDFSFQIRHSPRQKIIWILAFNFTSSMTPADFTALLPPEVKKSEKSLTATARFSRFFLFFHCHCGIFLVFIKSRRRQKKSCKFQI